MKVKYLGPRAIFYVWKQSLQTFKPEKESGFCFSTRDSLLVLGRLDYIIVHGQNYGCVCEKLTTIPKERSFSRFLKEIEGITLGLRHIFPNYPLAFG